jgi:hypothetical protein
LRRETAAHATNASPEDVSYIINKKVKEKKAVFQQLKHRYATLQADSRTAKERIDAQEKELIDAYTALAQKVGKASAGRSDTEVLMGVLKALGEDKCKLAFKVAKMRRALDSAEARIAKDDAECIALHNQTGALQSTFASEKDRLSEKAIEAQTRVDTNKASLVDQLREKSAAVNAHARQLSDMRAANETLEAAVQENQRAMDECTQRLSEDASNNVRLRTEIESLQSNISQLCEKITSVESDTERNLALISSLRNVLADRDECIASLEDEVLGMVDMDVALQATLAARKRDAVLLQQNVDLLAEFLRTSTVRTQVNSGNFFEQLQALKALSEEFTHTLLSLSGANRLMCAVWSDERFAIDCELKSRQIREEVLAKRVTRLMEDNAHVGEEISIVLAELQRYNESVARRVVLQVQREVQDIVYDAKALTAGMGRSLLHVYKKAIRVLTALKESLMGSVLGTFDRSKEAFIRKSPTDSEFTYASTEIAEPQADPQAELGAEAVSDSQRTSTAQLSARISVHIRGICDYLGGILNYTESMCGDAMHKCAAPFAKLNMPLQRWRMSVLGAPGRTEAEGEGDGRRSDSYRGRGRGRQGDDHIGSHSGEGDSHDRWGVGWSTGRTSSASSSPSPSSSSSSSISTYPGTPSKWW